MKIFYDHQIFCRQRYGGVSRYFHELASRIPRISGDEAKIFAPFHINDYLVQGKVRQDVGRKLKAFPGSPFALGLLDQLAGTLMVSPKRDVSIFHETYYSESRYAPKAAKRLVTVYDMIHELHPEAFPDDNRTKTLKRKAIARADHVICISENTRKDLVELCQVPARMISVVHLGSELTRQSESKVVGPVMGSPFLLYVGGRTAYKNFNGLLRAYAGSSVLRNDFLLVCFGGGRFTSAEEELMRSLDLSSRQVVSLQGSDEVLSALYSGASALVYPSFYEGFGIPPLEAMAHGCPVVCSNRSSVPEVVGDSALLFDPSNIEQIASCVELVVSDTAWRQTLISRGHVRAAQFSWDRCAHETLATYKRVLLE